MAATPASSSARPAVRRERPERARGRKAKATKANAETARRHLDNHAGRSPKLIHQRLPSNPGDNRSPSRFMRISRPMKSAKAAVIDVAKKGREPSKRKTI